ncbi:hypothetical protein [Parasphingorhabdus sp.]|jgi:hypothetical protein|uniref:hypothetical protein n=1 Tax=Parasphingorhabdus sp. TaxID=2709688 RepID=UPI003D2C3679
MNENSDRIIQCDTEKSGQLDGLHSRLAEHINAQNRLRSDYVNHVDFGEASWDIMLDLFASEYFNRSTSVPALAARVTISEALCDRYINYLLDQEKIHANRNPQTMAVRPFLVADATKEGIKAWLDNCMHNALQI